MLDVLSKVLARSLLSSRKKIKKTAYQIFQMIVQNLKKKYQQEYKYIVLMLLRLAV